MADHSADDRLRQREEQLPFSRRETGDVPAARQQRIRVRRINTWVKGAMEYAPDLLRMLRKILADGGTLY